LFITSIISLSVIGPFKIISYTGFSHMSLKTIGKVQCHNFQSHIWTISIPGKKCVDNFEKEKFA
jgi:hypothetical protein